MIEYLFQFKVFDIENTIKEEKALTQLLRKSPFSVRIQENTDQKKLRINTFHAVLKSCKAPFSFFFRKIQTFKNFFNKPQFYCRTDK